MVTALVTGGTGFVGSHVARVLARAGHQPRILRRQSSSLVALDGLDVQHAIGDVTDVASLLAAMDGCEWVFHVAAVADYWRAEKDRLYHVNVEGTRLVLDAAQRAGVGRVVFTSSGAAVGMRDDGRPADEQTPFNFNPKRFPYGHSKYLAEAEVHKAVQGGQDVVILNPAIVMGPGDLNMISSSIIVELKRGIVPAIPAGRATFIDVRDVAAAHVAAATKGRSGERYLLGAFDASWRELFSAAADVVGTRPPILPFPRLLADPLGMAVSGLRAAGIRVPIDGNQVRLSARNVVFDCHKAWQELGTPQVGLHQMLEDTYQWYAARGMMPARRL